MARITGKHISATIPVEVFDALTEYRFENRIDKLTDVIRMAVTAFAVEHAGYVEPAHTPEDGTSHQS